jgi:hypothetical protein
MSPLDCFDASLINPRCASIMPKVAVIFSNMAKDPRSKAVSVSPNLQLLPDHPKDATGFLVQATSDLSHAAPFFGEQVNKLMSLIISVMSAAGPSGFASAEAGAETRLANSKPQPSNNNSPSPPEYPNVDFSTLPAEIKKPSKPEAPQMYAGQKMPFKPTMALESRKSLQGNRNNKESSLPTLSVDRNDIVPLLKDVMTSLSRNKKDAHSTMTTHPFLASREGKKKESDDDGKRKDIDHIPKCQKIPFVIDRNQVESSSHMLSADRNDVVVAQSKDVMTYLSHNKMDTQRNTSTPSFPASTEGKRKEADKGSRRKDVDQTPKCQKDYFVFQGKVGAPPTRDTPDLYNG